MNDDPTLNEAILFAIAIHEVVNRLDPVMPNVVIMETASKVDFASDTLAEDVRRVVEQLLEVPDDKG